MKNQTPLAMIHVNQVTRSFRSPKKKEGKWSSLAMLVKPQTSESWALKGVSLDVEAGAFIGLIGANGAGKTTLLKILSGLIPPTAGEVRVLGQEPFKRSLDFRKQIALVMGQKAQLWWDLPAIDAFDLIRAIYDIPHDIYQSRLKSLGNILEVEKLMHTQIRRLSLGERMKMELIGALLHWPKVIFLDEPTIGLDLIAAQRLRDFLREFNQREKATIILTSHNMDDIERLCSRVLILREGELIYDGKPQGLSQEGAREISVRLLETPTILEVSQVTGLSQESVQIIESQESGGQTEGDGESDNVRLIKLRISQDQIAKTLQALLGKFQILDLSIGQEDLETVIQRLLGSDPSRTVIPSSAATESARA